MTTTEIHRTASSIPMIFWILSDPIYSVLVGLFLRLFLAWFLPYLLDGGQGVSYTDIDFLVFTDAAAYIKQGQSPYDRHTYRYTPFLAALLSKFSHNKEIGRYLFCVADTACGWIILLLRRHQRTHQQRQQTTDQKQRQQYQQLMDAIWWLYNPLAINICTRGSAESLIVLLPVLLTYWIATSHERRQHTNQSSAETANATILQALMSGFFHGIAVHSKLYPIIYLLSYMVYFATPPRISNSSTIHRKITNTFPWRNPIKCLRLAYSWFMRLFWASPPLPLIFLISFLTTFVTLAWLAVYYYGDRALQEGFLYHLSRVDHRHNYSMYWYWIYLARGGVAEHSAESNTGIATGAGAYSSSLFSLGRLLVLPQVILLAYSSVGMASKEMNQLGLTIFVQTFLFVTHNKVITAQYFTWYLCLLPLCSDQICWMSTRVLQASILLGISILCWLGSAYTLEMIGMCTYRVVWIASVLYFLANVNWMGALLQAVSTNKNNGIRLSTSRGEKEKDSVPFKETKVD